MSSPASALKLENVLYEKKGPIAYVTVNRPKVLNALNQAVFADLKTAFEDARDDASVRGVVLTGAGDKAFAAGADIVQIDEPWMQSRPQQARRFGIAALDAALDGVTGTTAVHICFGYAAVVKDKPSGYSFLSELERSAVGQVSIEAAQPRLDLSILRHLPSKTIILGVIDLSDPAVETPATAADRIRNALPFVAAERIVVAPDCGLKYLSREVAYGKMRAMVEGARIVREELAVRSPD